MRRLLYTLHRYTVCTVQEGWAHIRVTGLYYDNKRLETNENLNAVGCSEWVQFVELFENHGTGVSFFFVT